MTVQTLLAHDRPVPRYTSFPTVPNWVHDTNGALPAVMQALDQPAQIYVHVPFCRRQCLYCGCNMVVSKRQSAGDRWLVALAAQLEAVPEFEAEALHLGGGTPTWLDSKQIKRLLALFSDRFGTLRISVEADPETLDDPRLEALRGIERLSLGVQSFDPEVIRATGRDQKAEAVVHAARRARWLGVESLNIDLMYGLPQQCTETLSATLASTISMAPDRIAVFGYAHVPAMKPHQAKMGALPGPSERAEMALFASKVLTDAGYVPIGIDHFALPGDPLAQGVVERGFMGYTPKARPVIGLGPSAISAVNGVFLQQESKLGPWLRTAGDFPVQRFYRSTDEERRRCAVITEILCTLAVELDWSAYPEARDRLEHELPEVVELHPDGLRIDPQYRLLARNVASAFDPSGGRKGSRAI